jgi:tetratricopeptide (TPR) repeat protein
LRKTGKLDQAITELEQRVTANPGSAVDVTALGEGYYKKAGNTDDVRERATLAMKADQTLEAALNLEPSNWEARFTKAAGMSYWPAELNKGKEVTQELQTLIQQQETQASQPQFARTYVLLGEQYEKAGRANDAAQVWQSGAKQFPNDSDLQHKLAAQQQADAGR